MISIRLIYQFSNQYPRNIEITKIKIKKKYEKSEVDTVRVAVIPTLKRSNSQVIKKRNSKKLKNTFNRPT